MSKFNQIGTINTYLKEDNIFIEGVGFYSWNDVYWEKVIDTKFKRMLLNILKDELNENEISGNLVDNICKLSQLELFVSQETLNNNPKLTIVFQNGTYDVLNKKFHNNIFFKEDYNTRIINCSYEETDITNWNNYLNSTFKGDEDCLSVVQEMMGYVLYPECTYEKSFILYGNGANGKSVLLNTIQEMIGDYNTSYISMKDLEQSFLRSNLLGKSLNISSELEKSVGKTENFKKLVSGESVEAQFKYKDSFHFKNKAKLLFAMNQLSFISDLSDGLFRRLAIIPFNNQFKKEDRDPFLIDKLKNEIDGIAFWAVKGLNRLIDNNDFSTVSSIEDMTNELKESNNPILRFKDDCIEIADNNYYIEKLEVYRMYATWCRDNGNKPMNSNNFYKQIYKDFNLEASRKTINGERINCIMCIKKLKEDNQFGI